MGAEQNYKRISVCKILAQPNTKDLQDVVVDADLANARPHGVVLIDQHCPGKGLLLEFPSTGEDETVANLEKSIRDGSAPLVSSGKFCGKIKRDAVTKRFVLSLRLVQNLQPKNP
jgi:hypothetical protein